MRTRQKLGGQLGGLAARNPRAALDVDERIASEVESLLRFPELGRPGRIEGTRELIIQQTAFVAACMVQEKTIRILCILHGAQRWPMQLKDATPPTKGTP